MSLIDNMPHRATLSRPDYTQDELGGDIETLETITTDIACWVQNANMAEVKEYAKADTRITHKVFFPADPGVRPGDNLTVTSGPSFVDLTMEFRAGPTDRSVGLAVVWACVFEECNNFRRI